MANARPEVNAAIRRTAAGTGGSSRAVSLTTANARNAAAPAPQMAESRLVRQAISATGMRVIKNPRSVHVGYPVGWATPHVNAALASSPLSELANRQVIDGASVAT